MRVTIAAKRYETGEELKKYVERKLDRLTKYVPRHARKTLHADVHLSEHPRKVNPYYCEIVLHLPHGQLVASEATINMFAAVDIVEAKLKNQLHRYKQRTTSHESLRIRAWRRLLRDRI